MTTAMELSNLFKLVTKSGHSSLDAVKSAIQKYARRGMHKEMHQAVSEMDAFSAFDDSPLPTTQRAAKAIRTNMINRLKVILFEDVSFSQIGAFTTVSENRQMPKRHPSQTRPGASPCACPCAHTSGWRSLRRLVMSDQIWSQA